MVDLDSDDLYHLTHPQKIPISSHKDPRNLGSYRVLGTLVFSECNPHSSSAIIFGVQSTLQSRFIFGVRSDTLQTALQYISLVGVQIEVLPLQFCIPNHIISVNTAKYVLLTTRLLDRSADVLGMRSAECGAHTFHSLATQDCQVECSNAGCHFALQYSFHSTLHQAECFPLRHSKMTRIFGVVHSTECQSK